MSTSSADTHRYWYKWFCVECVLCGTVDAWKERQYTPKPTDDDKRMEYTQTACSDHFL